MKRSSSKMITRARSMRNVAKVPFRFKFDLLIETVDKLAASGDIVVVWERGTKVDGTKAAKIDKASRKATFNNERISAEITLYKSSPSEKKFQDKVVKIAIRAGSLEGKTLGKIHLNLADYAEVPSGSKRIGAEMSNGATLVTTVQCNFQSMGKASAKGDKKGEAEADDDDDDDGCRESDAVADEDVPSNFMKSKFSANMKRAVSKKTIRKDKNSDDSSSSAPSAANNADTERLRKENARLRKQLDEAEKAGGGGGGGDGDGSAGDAKAVEENKALRREVKDLKSALAREPVYSDVVKELKEAKMALALMNLEKEEIQLELHKMYKASSPLSQS